MNPLDAYVARQLAERVRSRTVVVWYDPHGELAPFVDRLRGGPRAGSAPVPVTVDGVKVHLAEANGSMFEVRAAVEPLVGKDTPDPLVVYLPGRERDARGSVLMELEKGGDCWEPELAHLARQVLRDKYTLGQVDEMLPADRELTYADLAQLAAGAAGGEPPSVLRAIFPDAGKDGCLAAWLVTDTRDGDVVAKAAVDELRKLVRSELGLELPADADLPKMRAHVLRYVLAGEFRSDLACAPPASLDSIPRPQGKDREAAVRKLALSLRTGAPEVYAGLADRVEKELGLGAASLPAGALGAIDTFRFEERALLQHCGELVATGGFEEALRIVGEREHSFWLDRDVARKAQWEACRRMAELGLQARQVRAAVSAAQAGSSPSATAWVEAYTAKDGWYRLDQAQRRLEAWMANLDDHPDERPLGIVRRAYEDACHAMAEGFTRALEKGQWSTTGVLHQTRIHGEVVAERPKPVAYFLVDAMRFEMGVELAERLPRTSEVAVRPAIAALPSITAIGMAALQPGAATSFTIAEEKSTGGRSAFGARIDGSFLKDVAARKKLAASRIPQLVDITLNDLLSLAPSKVKARVAGAQVIIVRSQEIDHAGEAGFITARQVMDTVIDNIGRALRKLAGEGVEHAVISADHGHLFAADRDESMKIDAPGGDTVEIHRRCWIGRGGKTPPGCVRVSAASLGYDADLDLIFPVGAGIFKAGGDPAFHHGGPSLQELIIPVLTVRTAARESLRPAAAAASPIAISEVPESVGTRTVSVVLTYARKQMILGDEPRSVRPLLVFEGRQVGVMGLAVGADYDAATGCVTLEPNKPVSVAFILTDDTATSVRIVVQDPATDAELARSPRDIPVRLGM